MNAQAHAKILIAGVGNIFLGDDGFGCEVVKSLGTYRLSDAVKVIDYGIRGLDLAYALIEPYEAIVLIDAISRGGKPGSVYLLQPVEQTVPIATSLNPHSMDPAHVVAMARLLGDVAAEIFIVGCEPEDFGDELTGRMGLSVPVTASLPEAVGMVAELVDRIQACARVALS